MNDGIRPRAYVAGLATLLPLLRKYTCRGTGGTIDPRYCYSIWLRHFVRARELCEDVRVRSVAEVGPGDSLGVGLAALITGCERYTALDAKMHADCGRNVAALREIVTMFTRREPIPGEDEFPRTLPKLEFYAFPEWLIAGDQGESRLSLERLAQIETELGDTSKVANEYVRYVAPWQGRETMAASSTDLIISQAVLEHVDDIHSHYADMASWLRLGGLLSAVIDFKCHGLAGEWWGHWTASDFEWKIIRGSRPYLLNRLPCSVHLEEMSRAGLDPVCVDRVRSGAAPRIRLATQFAGLSDDDLGTSAVFVQAIKRR